MNKIALLLASIALSGAAMAQAENEIFTSEYIVHGERFYLALRPKQDQKCSVFTTDNTTPAKVKMLNQRILGEAFVSHRGGYVYWLIDEGGTQEVFSAAFIIRNCVLTENRMDYKDFSGEHAFRLAEAYYTQVVKQNTE